MRSSEQRLDEERLQLEAKRREREEQHLFLTAKVRLLSLDRDMWSYLLYIDYHGRDLPTPSRLRFSHIRREELAALRSPHLPHHEVRDVQRVQRARRAAFQLPGIAVPSLGAREPPEQDRASRHAHPGERADVE